MPRGKRIETKGKSKKQLAEEAKAKLEAYQKEMEALRDAAQQELQELGGNEDRQQAHNFGFQDADRKGAKLSSKAFDNMPAFYDYMAGWHKRQVERFTARAENWKASASAKPISVRLSEAEEKVAKLREELKAEAG